MDFKTMTNINNYVFVDIGDTDGAIREHKVKGSDTIIYLASDPDYSGFTMLKRTGKVLNAPEKLRYYKPYMLRSRLENVIVKQGDVVFFEPETKSYCEKKELVYRQEDGSRIFAIPYHLLICVVDKDNSEITMLNGKVLVKRLEHEVEKNGIITQLEYDNNKANWVEIVSTNEKEGYTGVFMTPQIYFPMTYRKQNLQTGMQVLIKQYSSFDLQAAIKEYKDIDELNNTYVVERHKIMAVKDLDGKISAYGLYIEVEPIEEKEENNSIIIKINKKKVNFKKGKVISIGGGVDACVVGDIILYNEHSKDTFDNKVFVHNEWVEDVIQDNYEYIY